MAKTIITCIAAIALLLYTIALFFAYKAAKKGDPATVGPFNKGFWSYIITSVNSLLIVNLTTLLGLPVYWSKNLVNFQQGVAIAYLVLLVIIFLYWAIGKKFDESDKMPVVIPQLSKSFFALMLAALGLVLKEQP